MSPPKELAQAYFDGLRDAYCREGGQAMWDHFASIAHGSSQEDLAKLLEVYPDAPESLLELLKLVDGTYYREYPKGKVCFYFLGSDMEGCPYYLLSARQMVKAKGYFDQWGESHQPGIRRRAGGRGCLRRYGQAGFPPLLRLHEQRRHVPAAH